MVQRRARPVALDHNFPEPILRALAKYMPEVDFHWVRELDPAYPELEDHDLIYNLYRVGFSIMVTDNYKMARDPRVLVAVEETRVSLLTIKGAGDDPILATGVLLRDLMPIIRNDPAKGLIYEIHPARVQGKRARGLAEKFPGGYDALKRQHGIPLAQRQRFDEDDPRRQV